MQRLVKEAQKRHPGLNSGGVDGIVVGGGGESASSFSVLDWAVTGTSVASCSLDFSWLAFSLLGKGSDIDLRLLLYV